MNVRRNISNTKDRYGKRLCGKCLGSRKGQKEKKKEQGEENKMPYERRRGGEKGKGRNRDGGST